MPLEEEGPLLSPTILQAGSSLPRSARSSPRSRTPASSDEESVGSNEVSEVMSPQVSQETVSVFIFNPFFFHFYCPTRSTVLTFSQSLPMLPYVILEISPCFPIEWTLTSFSFSLPSRQFTRYQEQDLLVVIFGLLRTIPTIPTILTISTISLPPPDLPYDLSRGSLQTREYLTSYLEMANSLLPHLNSRSYW